MIQDDDASANSTALSHTPVSMARPKTLDLSYERRQSNLRKSEFAPSYVHKDVRQNSTAFGAQWKTEELKRRAILQEETLTSCEIHLVPSKSRLDTPQSSPRKREAPKSIRMKSITDLTSPSMKRHKHRHDENDSYTFDVPSEGR